MFRPIGGRLSPWESLLPPELLRVPQERTRVDALLDDPAFFVPAAPHFHPVLGRPSTPIECYLRLMFLKFRYRRPPETSPQDYGCAFWGSGPDAKVTIVDPAATPAGQLCPEQPNTEALPCERVLRKGLACQGSRPPRQRSPEPRNARHTRGTRTDQPDLGIYLASRGSHGLRRNPDETRGRRAADAAALTMQVTA